MVNYLKNEQGKKKAPSGLNTMIASERSLAKSWLTKEEDEAWKHLQENAKE